MANIIAVIWDCDKTLVDGYMQDPIFEDYKINSADFWKKVNTRPEELAQKGIRVNRDTYYLNYFIQCAHDGTLKGLNNAKLKDRSFIKVFQKSLRRPKICSKTIKDIQNMEFKLNTISSVRDLLKLFAAQN